MNIEIRDLHAGVDGKEILNGVTLNIGSGEFHVVMGPNGSGKTTLAKAIIGHPGVHVSSGDILVDGKSILKLQAYERARLGIFLQFQNPIEVEGVGFVNFMRSAKSALTGGTVNVSELMSEIKNEAALLHIENDIIGRSLNYGLSGGEKKKAEILQMAVFKPKIAILDEPDSGLDVDAVRIVANRINELAEKERMGILLITHYTRILAYMKPQFVHVMVGGKIVESDGAELASRIEKSGYEPFEGV